MKYLNKIITWKKFSRSKIISCAFLLFGLSLVMESYAQMPKICGNTKINKEALLKAVKYEKDRPGNLLAPAPALVRVYFHICRNSDGTNAATTEAQIQREYNQLKSDYAAGNICFAYMGLDYIDNTEINTTYNVDDPAKVALLQPYRVPNCINIFYHVDIGPYAGNAYTVPSTYCSLNKWSTGDMDGRRLVSHEVGHCLGLLHTFEGCDGSYINGTDCATTGDWVCDTDADPACFGSNSCWSSSGCLYTGSCTDAGGASNWHPPYSNIMSYWCTLTQLTPGQYDRVHSFLGSDPDLMGCLSSSSATVSNINISSGYYFASTIFDLTTNSSVVISGTAKATFAGETVLLEPGFVAGPANGGYLLVRGTLCTYSAPALMARAGSATIKNSEIISKNEQAALLAFPNPASSEVRLLFNLAKNERNALVRVYNINGKKELEMTMGYLVAGKQNIQLNVNSLSAGVYYVYLQLNTKRLGTKVVLVK